MLRVENLDVFYGDAQALDAVSLEVEEGAIVAIVGANGAGKTSLIRAIAGMLRPRSGRIVFGNTDIAGWPSYRVCNLGIGQVAEGRQIFPTLSVAENLDMGALLPRARAGAKKIASACWRCFRCSPSASGRRPARSPAASSRCSRSARCLMGAPELIMFDEPSLGLAPAIAHDVLDTIRDLNREGLTCLLVEQNVALSLKLASRAYVLENGRVTLDRQRQRTAGRRSRPQRLSWAIGEPFSRNARAALHQTPSAATRAVKRRQRKGLAQPAQHIGRARHFELGKRRGHGARHVSLGTPEQCSRDHRDVAERDGRLHADDKAGAHGELQFRSQWLGNAPS